MGRVRLRWAEGGRRFVAVEPDEALVEEHASRLLSWYNAPENAAMMGGSATMSRDDVIEFWAVLRRGGGRGFLASVDDELIGDADLRGLDGGAAEFALLVGDEANKGRGYGRAIARMVHVFAFRELGLDTLFVPPRRDNVRVHALNAFLGYKLDGGARARTYVDGPDSDTYSLSASVFRQRHPDIWRDLAVEALPEGGAL